MFAFFETPFRALRSNDVNFVTQAGLIGSFISAPFVEVIAKIIIRQIPIIIHERKRNGVQHEN
jgi:hypothetical protein